MQTHFEEYRGQTDHKYKHQHNYYILTDVQVNFTSKAPTVMVIALLSVSPNMDYLSSTCFWSHESEHNADKKSPDPFTHLYCFIVTITSTTIT